MMKWKSYLAAALAALSLGTALSGCSGGDESSIARTTTAAPVETVKPPQTTEVTTEAATTEAETEAPTELH